MAYFDITHRCCCGRRSNFTGFGPFDSSHRSCARARSRGYGHNADGCGNCCPEPKDEEWALHCEMKEIARQLKRIANALEASNITYTSTRSNATFDVSVDSGFDVSVTDNPKVDYEALSSKRVDPNDYSPAEWLSITTALFLNPEKYSKLLEDIKNYLTQDLDE